MLEAEGLWVSLQRLWASKIYDPNVMVKVEGCSVPEHKPGRKRRRRNVLQGRKVYAKLPDGQYVVLICPGCQRELFANVLGFANHCRIVHQLKFSSLDEVAKHCGTPVDESAVPPDDPSRAEKTLDFLVNEKKLASTRIDLTQPQIVPRHDPIDLTQPNQPHDHYPAPLTHQDEHALLIHDGDHLDLLVTNHSQRQHEEEDEEDLQVINIVNPQPNSANTNSTTNTNTNTKQKPIPINDDDDWETVEDYRDPEPDVHGT